MPTSYHRRQTPITRRMAEVILVRNLAPRTIDSYNYHVDRFARHFGKLPEDLGPEQIREFQLWLIQVNQASWSQFNQAVCALRFLYTVTLPRPWPVTMIPFGKRPNKCPCHCRHWNSLAAGRGTQVSAMQHVLGTGISHASSSLARAVLRPGPSALDGMEGQRMITRLARRSRPSLYLVESDRDHSTRLALRTEKVPGSGQPVPRPPSWLLRQPHSGLVKLPGRLRTH